MSFLTVVIGAPALTALTGFAGAVAHDKQAPRLRRAFALATLAVTVLAAVSLIHGWNSPIQLRGYQLSEASGKFLRAAALSTVPFALFWGVILAQPSLLDPFIRQNQPLLHQPADAA